jgi:Arc/MetJ-type ribon-helix-helix transcriptional regulator
MRTAKTVSITLPPDLLVKAQEVASREHRTMSELFREALRRYLAPDTQWESFLLRTRAKGRELDIASEADVERLSDEHRRKKMTRVVLDTNIYNSALMFGGCPVPLLDLALLRAFTLIISPALLDELEKKLRAKFEMTIGDAAFLRSRLETLRRLWSRDNL